MWSGGVAAGDQPVDALYVDPDAERRASTAAGLEAGAERLSVVPVADRAAALAALGGVDAVVCAHAPPALDAAAVLSAVRERHPDRPLLVYTDEGSESLAATVAAAAATDYRRRDETDPATVATAVVDAVDRGRRRRGAERDGRRLSLFVEQSPLGVLEWDESFEAVRLNPAAEEILGYTEAELAGESWDAIVPDADREAVDEVVSALLADRGGYHSVNENVTADGDRVVCEWHNRVVTDDDGDVVAVFSQFQDVTDRVHHRRRLDQLRERSRAMMHTPTREATAEVALDAAAEVLGAEMAGLHLLNDDGDRLDPVATLDTVRETLDGSPAYERDGGPVSRLVWSAVEDGNPRVIGDTRRLEGVAERTPARSGFVYPLADHGVFILSATEPEAFDETDRTLVGIFTAVLQTALDRAARETELRERETELRRRNERLEEFASVVSHDLRNPLNVASGRLETARENVDSEHLRRVGEAHERMSALLEDLLALARGGTSVGEPEPVSLATVAEDAWSTVATDDAALALGDDRTVLADRGRLRQLLENLFRNAVEHGSTSSQQAGDAAERSSTSNRTPSGDAVEPGSTDGEDAERSDDAAGRDGGSVTVEVGATADGFAVADDGPGIPAEERDAVFETGRSGDGGTGFGLAIVREVAQAHGWEVGVTEGDAGGARFEVTGVEADD